MIDPKRREELARIVAEQDARRNTKVQHGIPINTSGGVNLINIWDSALRRVSRDGFDKTQPDGRTYMEANNE